MSDSSWDEYLEAGGPSIESIEQSADDLATESADWQDLGETMGEPGEPLVDASADLTDASSSTDAAGDWSTWAKGDMDVADGLVDDAAFHAENAELYAESGWGDAADWEMTQAGNDVEMAGDYQDVAGGELDMSQDYLADADASVDVAYDTVEAADLAAPVDDYADVGADLSAE